MNKPDEGIPKPRKLQSDRPCKAINANNHRPCSFTAKPGYHYCLRHCTVEEAWNTRLRTEAVMLVPSDPEDKRVLGPVFMLGMVVGQTLNLRYRLADWEQIDGNDAYLRADEVDWKTSRPCTDAEIEPFLTITRLPESESTGESSVRKVH